MSSSTAMASDSVASALESPIATRAIDQVSPLTAEQIQSFWANGFLLVDDVSSREEIAAMRVVYDRLFARRAGWETGDLFDMVARDDLEKGLSLPQMLWPSRYEPFFKTTLARRNAERLAAQILGPSAQNMNEHAILKPAFTGAATPWHQDEAFNTEGSGFRESIAMWMPLQDVSEENGCLWYVPESHLGPLHTHRSPNNDPTIHGLETDPPELSRAVPVPMRAGSVVIHHSMTLHSAGVNTGSEPRRSYALGFGVKTQRNLLSRDYPWNLEKRTAREKRHLRSLSAHQLVAYKLKRWLHGHRPWH